MSAPQPCGVEAPLIGAVVGRRRCKPRHRFQTTPGERCITKCRQGCDTLAAFGFTGIPPAKDPAKDIVDRAACTLRALDASSVTTRVLDIPAIPGACAVRSSGCFTAARLRLWGFSTYIAGSEQRGNGRLVQHSLFVMTQRRTQLRTAIADLSDAVHTTFRTIAQTA